MSIPPKVPELEAGYTTQPETVFFAKRDREWVAAKWRLIRQAQQEADKAIAKWRRVSDEVNTHLDSHHITDIIQRGRVRGENLSMQDAMSTAQWFRAEAQAHIADVTLFLRLKEMGLL